MKFDIFLRDCVEYVQVEADTEKEAIEIALDWWIERTPEISVTESEEEDE